jgi:preprotein translocase subunit SecE
MTDDIKAQDAGTADQVKLAVAILIAIAGIVGYYWFAAQPSWIRWASVGAGLVLGALVVAFSYYGAAFRQFMELARIELRKIVWPTRQETGITTLVVFVFVIAFGVFFWLLDLLLAWATKTLTGQGGG